MPIIEDYSEDEEGGPIGARSRVALGGGGQQAQQSSPQREQEFTPWSRFVNANAEVSEREAGKLQSHVQNDVNAAEKGRDDAASAQTRDIQSNYTGQPEQRAESFGRVPQAAQGASGFGQQPAAFGGPAMAPQQPQGDVLASRSPASAQMSKAQIGGEPPPSSGPAPTIDPDRLETDLSSGAPHTEGAGILGGKDLEQQIGADAWGKLVGDTAKAGQEAGALGSTSGVQSLLGQHGTAFDAALVGGSGGREFDALAKQYGKNQLGQQLQGANQSAQEQWSKLMGDVESAAGARDASINAATDEMNGIAAGQQQKAAQLADAQDKFNQQLEYLKKTFPISESSPFNSKDGFLEWMGGQTSAQENQNLTQWTTAIYGADALAQYGAGGLAQKLYEDVKRMTPEEYEAFKYGVVPAWMGLGIGALGKFGGLGYRGNKTTIETTDDLSGADEEDRKKMQDWKTAMSTMTEIMAAIASAG